VDIGIRETFAAQHRALREAYERTRAHAALSLVANPPHLAPEPPALGMEEGGRRAPPTMHSQPAPLAEPAAGGEEDASDEEEEEEEEVQPQARRRRPARARFATLSRRPTTTLAKLQAVCRRSRPC
jgi:hypothetical protein